MARPKKRPKDGPLWAIGYLRVSTAEQADSGAGLDAQRSALAAAAAQRGWLLSYAVDEGVSAGDSLTEARLGLAGALATLAAGQADVLMVSKLDRLSRSVAHGAGLLELARKQGWAVVALDLDVDTTSPSGEMFGNVLLTMARFEKRLIGQRTKDALAAKKAAGVRLGRPSMLPTEVVARIVARRAAGVTLTAIAAELNDDQVPTAHGAVRWWPATVAAVLRGQDAGNQLGTTADVTTGITPAAPTATADPAGTRPPAKRRAPATHRVATGTVDETQVRLPSGRMLTAQVTDEIVTTTRTAAAPTAVPAGKWEPAGFSAAFTIATADLLIPTRSHRRTPIDAEVEQLRFLSREQYDAARATRTPPPASVAWDAPTFSG